MIWLVIFRFKVFLSFPHYLVILPLATLLKIGSSDSPLPSTPSFHLSLFVFWMLDCIAGWEVLGGWTSVRVVWIIGMSEHSDWCLNFHQIFIYFTMSNLWTEVAYFGVGITISKVKKLINVWILLWAFWMSQTSLEICCWYHFKTLLKSPSICSGVVKNCLKEVQRSGMNW